MDVIDRLLIILKKRNIKGTDIARILGLKKSPLTDWKNKHSKPTLDQIIIICEKLAISADYLLLGTLHNNELSFTEISLLKKFNKLDDVKKERIIERIDTYLEIHETENHNLHEGMFAAEDTKHKYGQNKKSEITVKHIPILGQTAAGPPIDIVEIGGGDYVAVPETADTDYALFVKGDSMAPTINDKDLVFIKSMPEVENGTIGVVDIDGTVTCKKIHRYNGRVELISLNKNYDPIVVDLSKTPFRIIGKVMFFKSADSNFFAI